MELRQLQYFLTVAEELNFTRAAERLNITQPPLSAQIKNLETELGLPLFERNNRHVELTHVGKIFVEDVKKGLDYLSRAVENAQRAQRGEIGTLGVGFVGSATYDILPSMIREFGRTYPNVKIRLHELSTPRAVEALVKEEIDIGVIRPPITHEAIHTEIVSEVPCVLAVPRQHPLSKIGDISIRDLAPYPFVMLSRRTWAGLYDEILSLCKPVIRQEAFEFQTVIGLVAAGLGIAIVPQSAMNFHTQDVEYLDLRGQLPVAYMGVAWHKDNDSPLVKSFVAKAKMAGLENAENTV